MITPKQALDWHVFKAECGPTYAGSTGWKRFTDFLISKMPEFGAVDLDYVDIPYDHYIVEDWPDRRTHMHELAERGREARHRRHAGAGRRLLRHDVGLHAARRHHGADALSTTPAHPPADVARSPARSSSSRRRSSRRRPTPNNFLDNYTLTDYEWRSPGKWPELFTPPPRTEARRFTAGGCGVS